MYVYYYHVIIIICYKVNVQKKKKSKVFFFRILNILTYTKREREEGLKKTDNDVYPKGPNA